MAAWNVRLILTATPGNWDPAITADGNRIDVFDEYAPGPSTMEHNWSVGGDPWQQAGMPGNLPIGSGIVAASFDGVIDVAALVAQNGPGSLFWWRLSNGAGSAPVELPDSQTVTAQPAVAKWSSERLDLFAVVDSVPGGDVAGKLRHWWIEPPVNQAALGNEDLEGEDIAPWPCAVSWGPERLDVFATGANGLLHWYFDQPNGRDFGAPETLAGGRAFSPCAASWGSERLDVFAVSDATGEILHWVFDGSGQPIVNFGTPQPLGESAGCGPPCAVSWGPGRFDVFAVDGEDKLRHWWYQRGGGSGLDHADMSLASEQQGTTVISAPAASSASSNTLEVVAVCSANEVVVDGTVRNGQFIEHWTWS